MQLRHQNLRLFAQFCKANSISCNVKKNYVVFLNEYSLFFFGNGILRVLDRNTQEKTDFIPTNLYEILLVLSSDNYKLLKKGYLDDKRIINYNHISHISDLLVDSSPTARVFKKSTIYYSNHQSISFNLNYSYTYQS